MESQKENIVLYDIKLLNDALDSISSKKCFDQCTYENVKTYVGAIESLRDALVTLDKLQEMVKKYQEEQNNAKHE
jgi:hypothetical protein